MEKAAEFKTDLEHQQHQVRRELVGAMREAATEFSTESAHAFIERHLDDPEQFHPESIAQIEAVKRAESEQLTRMRADVLSVDASDEQLLLQFEDYRASFADRWEDEEIKLTRQWLAHAELTRQRELEGLEKERETRCVRPASVQ